MKNIIRLHWILALHVLLMSRGALADFKLEPDHFPLPTYDTEAEKVSFDIKVRVKYTIHNDGSVSDVSLVDTNHPAYAESVMSAVASWRYKPWPLDGNPPTTELISTFTKSRDPTLNASQREALRNMRCRHLTREIARFREANPDEPLTETQTARRTRKMVRIGPLDLPYQQSMDLALQYEVWFFTTVEMCRDSPNKRYLDYLPEALKKWM